MSKKKITVSVVITIVFLTWFIASFVGLIWAGNTNHGSLVVTFVGQYLAVFGIAASVFYYKKRKEIDARRKASRRYYEDEEIGERKFNPNIFFPVLISIVGIVCLAIGLLMFFGYIHID